MSRDPLAIRLHDAQSEQSLVGNKAARLSEISSIGLLVPSGYTVTAHAHRLFLERNEPSQRIYAIENQIDWTDLRQVRAAAAQIAELLSSCTVPEEVILAVKAIHAATCGVLPVAVRSSSSAEDLPQASFAGQQDSFLNVHGDQAILAAIPACWNSTWSERSLIYRHRAQAHLVPVVVPVLIQVMIMADVAGVAFSANPISGSRREIMINSNWGLGETVASGDVVPDQITVDKVTGEIISLHIGSKTHKSRAEKQGGTRLELVEERLRSIPSLRLKQIAQVVEAVRAIEDFFQAPQDIEWAIQDDKLWILQVRPITTPLR